MMALTPCLLAALTIGIIPSGTEYTGKVSDFAKTVSSLVSDWTDVSGEQVFPEFLNPQKKGKKRRRTVRPIQQNTTRPNEVVMKRRTATTLEAQASDQNEAHFFAFEERKTRRQFCQGGIRVFNDETLIVCEGIDHDVSTAEFIAMNFEEQRKCSLKDPSTKGYCVCPDDCGPLVKDGVLACDFYAPVECSLEMINPKRCPESTYNLDWMKPCNLYSSDEKITVSINLTCTIETDAAENRRVLTDNKWYWDVKYVHGNANELFVDTIQNIKEGHFKPLVKGIKKPFGMTMSHWLYYSNVGLVFKLYNLNRPSDNAWKWETTFRNMSKIDGLVTGEVPKEIELDFAQVPGRYFHSGRIYAEAGLLFSSNHTEKMFFDFPEYRPPPYTQVSDFNTIMLLVTGVVLGTLILIVFVVCMRYTATKNALSKKSLHVD